MPLKVVISKRVGGRYDVVQALIQYFHVRQHSGRKWCFLHAFTMYLSSLPLTCHAR